MACRVDPAQYFSCGAMKATLEQFLASIPRVRNTSVNCLEFDRMNQKLNACLVNKYPMVYNLDYCTMGYDCQIKMDVRRRKLSARYEYDNGVASFDDVILTLAAQIAEEAADEILRCPEPCQYWTCIPAFADRVVIDPTTFDPVVVFHTSFALVKVISLA